MFFRLDRWTLTNILFPARDDKGELKLPKPAPMTDLDEWGARAVAYTWPAWYTAKRMRGGR